jgi:hypothetical protein
MCKQSAAASPPALCQYAGSMKATFRLPDALAEELRKRSEEEGRSINATAVDALWRGLGREREDDDVDRIFGTWIVKRATPTYDAEAVRRKVALLGDAARGLDEALEGTREEQS